MKNNIKIKLMSLGLVMVATAFLSGCYTVHGAVVGAGKDVNALVNGSSTSHHRVHKVHRVTTTSTQSSATTMGTTK